MSRLAPKHVAGALVLALAAASSWAAALTAGPMVGTTDMHTTTIWLQADAPARAEIEYWPLQQGTDRVQRVTTQLQASEDNAGRVRIDNLQAGTRCGYRVKVDGREVGALQQFQTQVRWQ